MTAVTTTIPDKLAMAKMYAEQHLEIDTGIEFVFHLPTGAAELEIRLLEVNNLIADMRPLEAIDFGINRNTPDEHSLCVLDLTPGQWHEVQSGKLALPTGWSLDGRQQIYPRPSS